MVSPIRTRPCNEGIRSREERIAAAIGAIGGRLLPVVSEDTLKRYHRYLAARLSFPFAARSCGDSDTGAEEIWVVGLTSAADTTTNLSSGVLCLVRWAGREIVLPLFELELEESDANSLLIEDYWYWFWNWQSAPGSAAPRYPR